jgi:transposase-like protein
MTTGEQTMSPRRTFSGESKLAVVEKVIEQSLSFAEVARDMGIRDTLIYGWKKPLKTMALTNRIDSKHSVGAEPKPLSEECRQLTQ